MENSDTVKIEEIVPMIEKVKNTIIFMQEDLYKLAEELNTKEKMLEEREKKLTESQNENVFLQESYMAVQEELNKILALYSDLSGKEETSINIQHILSVYVTLLENVFEGKPHAKILLILHGEKNQFGRQHLNQTLGFSPAVVLHSIHELQRAGLIDYDEETELVTRKEKLY